MNVSLARKNGDLLAPTSNANDLAAFNPVYYLLEVILDISDAKFNHILRSERIVTFEQ
jgi:hypothetical protein